MKKIRYGFTLMHKHAKALMVRYKIKAPGSYLKSNHHQGVMWAYRKECHMTNDMAEAIFWRLWQTKKLTEPQMKAVSKTFAYSYELMGGQPGGNWAGVKGAWSCMVFGVGEPEVKSCLPVRIPTPQQLKDAFTRQWDGRQPLVMHCGGVVAAWDIFVCGARSKMDVKKVKDSLEYVYDYDDKLYCKSKFENGRSKLRGKKVGKREWGGYRVCTCKDGKYSRPPSDLVYELNKEGNPQDG